MPSIAVGIIFGAIFLFPFTILLSEGKVMFSYTAVFSILWLVVPVSIISVNIWLRMLKIDPVKASFLFLSPIFGFIFATVILGEPFTIYTHWVDWSWCLRTIPGAKKCRLKLTSKVQ